jgi:hypothetical protein
MTLLLPGRLRQLMDYARRFSREGAAIYSSEAAATSPSFTVIRCVTRSSRPF